VTLPTFLKGLEERDPQLAEAVDQLWSVANEGPLDDKTRILITMALDALSGASGGVSSLAEQARSAGATAEEIAHALRLAYLVAGMQTLLTGNAAFNE